MCCKEIAERVYGKIRHELTKGITRGNDDVMYHRHKVKHIHGSD